ncbi:hypothetical protein [Salinimicrobium oceani]|uniref:Uncharacterized protein n=1 Tax=Salinimicrobium oceani TaxID=2722702 RepID=A0ABX1CW38_9FLAO|nr:hypothetical protein [Salinimicrobium oceani]NJW51554.1 hypothetical protein [Salinimicrobium oceani]
MRSEEIFETVKCQVKKLNKKEKIRLCSKIIPEFDLVLKTRKRGRSKSLEQAKEKLSKDFYWALFQEQQELR